MMDAFFIQCVWVLERKKSSLAQSGLGAQWRGGQVEDLLNLSLHPKMTNSV